MIMQSGTREKADTGVTPSEKLAEDPKAGGALPCVPTAHWLRRPSPGRVLGQGGAHLGRLSESGRRWGDGQGSSETLFGELTLAPVINNGSPIKRDTS